MFDRDRIQSWKTLLLALALLGPAACSDLLEVELPGQVRAEDLEQPRLAGVLARSVQGDFDCALSAYVWGGGLWANDLYQTDNFSRARLTQLRSDEVLNFDQLECDQFTFPPIYLPFQITRVQGEQAVELISAFPADAVDDRDYLLGKAHAYTGYAYQILGETMCELAFDGGGRVSRDTAMNAAEAQFSSALQYVGSAASGEARSIRNLALVGRARTRLNLGNTGGVVEDASQVDRGFVRYADLDITDDRLNNRVFNYVNRNQGNSSVHTDYRNLVVDGMPDPRVPLEHLADVQPFDGVSELWIQHKYTDLGSDIPFASWREAQLMIAEVSGGQTAVNIINDLRATVSELDFVDSAHPGLPAFASSDDAEIRAQVWEERRRELFLQGTKIGDMLRLDIPGVDTDDFETGVNQRGNPYGPHTCYPLPDQEML